MIFVALCCCRCSAVVTVEIDAIHVAQDRAVVAVLLTSVVVVVVKQLM